MPSMPVGFWNDPDGSRYRAAYFDDFPGVWRHGDWITFTERGACMITGRSDATLNRGGVRIGTAEFYAVVEASRKWPTASSSTWTTGGPAGPVRALGTGARLIDEAARPHRRRAADRPVAAPRPRRIEAVPAVPRTLSGKKLEVPVKRILTGTLADVAASRGSLADPSSLDAFVAMARED